MMIKRMPPAAHPTIIIIFNPPKKAIILSPIFPISFASELTIALICVSESVWIITSV